MVKVTCDPSPVENALNNTVRDLPGTFTTIHSQMGTRAVAAARMRHRFSSRSGALSSAVQSSADKDAATVEINAVSAPYGTYVHNGQRSWKPDPFVLNAIVATTNDNLHDLEKEFANSLRRNGLDVRVS
jgi:hypothetical protein